MSKRELKSQWSMLLITGYFKVPRSARSPRDWRMIYNDHNSDGFVMRYPAHVKPGDPRYVIAAIDMRHFGVYSATNDNFDKTSKSLQYLKYGASLEDEDNVMPCPAQPDKKKASAE